MIRKPIKAVVKLQIPAGQANPAPPVGPSLSQHGLNIMAFCKEFNEKTKNKAGYLIPVVITVYEDRTYSFEIKNPPVSQLIKRALSIEKGSGDPKRSIVGKLSKAHLEEIARTKQGELNARSLSSAMRIVAGTARSMGVEVEE